MKRIVIINQDSGYLMVDIANALIKNGLQTYLITGRLIPRNKPISEFLKIRRIAKYRRNSKLHRILSWISGFLQAFLIVKLKHRKDYLLIITNPPISTFLPIFCKNKFSLMIFDIYPEALIKAGIFSKNSLIAKFWQLTNRKAFLRADNIFTLTEGMSSVLKEYAGDKEIKVIPIWSDNEFFNPIPKDLNPFIKEHKLDNKFVVLYSGNLGASHNIEIIPELALRIKNTEVIFLIIGDGDHKKWLTRQIKTMNLKNCRLLPLQPVDAIPYSFASADLAIVSLATLASELSIPSKTFNFMSAGLPLLCITGPGSELNIIVNKYNNGRSFTPDKVEEIVAFIEDLAEKKNLVQLFRTNSLKASRDFSPNNAETIAATLNRSTDFN